MKRAKAATQEDWLARFTAKATESPRAPGADATPPERSKLLGTASAAWFRRVSEKSLTPSHPMATGGSMQTAPDPVIPGLPTLPAVAKAEEATAKATERPSNASHREAGAQHYHAAAEAKAAAAKAKGPAKAALKTLAAQHDAASKGHMLEALKLKDFTAEELEAMYRPKSVAVSRVSNAEYGDMLEDLGLSRGRR